MNMYFYRKEIFKMPKVIERNSYIKFRCISPVFESQDIFSHLSKFAIAIQLTKWLKNIIYLWNGI